MGWLYYLIEANCYLIIFYAFYYFVLKQETFYAVNRWYLLMACLVSFVLPFLTVNYISESIISVPGPPTNIVYDRPSAVAADQPQLQVISSSATEWTVEKMLPIFYFTVALVFFLGTLRQIFKLFILYRYALKQKIKGVIYIELDCKKEEIFSFFNWLFLHPKMYKNEVIIAHEMIHIKQGHSYDVLFFELLRCINWFNPFIYLLFKDAKLNHEYISDQSTSARMPNKYAYANLLIQHAYLPSERLSHSAFAETQLEQRIKHLGKHNSKRKAVLKYMALVPLLAILFFVSAFKIEKSYGLISLTLNHSRDLTSNPIPYRASTADPILIKTKVKSGTPEKNRAVQRYAVANKVETVFSGQQLSELVSGPTTMHQIAADSAKKGKKLYAIDYEMFWTLNPKNTKIRKVIHSLNIGTEAQLFRGLQADTLYVDRDFYTLNNDVLMLKTSNLMISYTNASPVSNKKLIVIDALKLNIMHTLTQVDIRTKGMIHTVVLNPYYGYGKDGVLDSVPKGHVDVKKRDANRLYVSSMMNNHIREAKITATQIITNETNFPKEDRWQSGILW